jgi:hypothetical protein
LLSRPVSRCLVSKPLQGSRGLVRPGPLIAARQTMLLLPICTVPLMLLLLLLLLLLLQGVLLMQGRTIPFRWLHTSLVLLFQGLLLLLLKLLAGMLVLLLMRMVLLLPQLLLLLLLFIHAAVSTVMGSLVSFSITILTAAAVCSIGTACSVIIVRSSPVLHTEVA